MAGRKRKTLSAEDRAIWQKIAQSTQPLRDSEKQPSLKALAKAASGASANQVITKNKPPGARRPSGEDLVPRRAVSNPGRDVPEGGVAMDHRRFDKMRRGKIKPQARLDLHGMTAARAHPALVDFVHDAHSEGLRLVLVITGKGNARSDDESFMPSRRGVLRHSVPQWLSRPPLGPLVLQLTPANIRHGGGGAFYVYLRRNRRYG